ncbi:MAG: DUF397 domain-containing protein [Streptosporangiaceae bacterium]
MTQHFTSWRKPTRSEANGSCVELGRSCDRTIGVRDTKPDRDRSDLGVQPHRVAAFTQTIRS